MACGLGCTHDTRPSTNPTRKPNGWRDPYCLSSRDTQTEINGDGMSSRQWKTENDKLLKPSIHGQSMFDGQARQGRASTVANAAGGSDSPVGPNHSARRRRFSCLVGASQIVHVRRKHKSTAHRFLRGRGLDGSGIASDPPQSGLTPSSLEGGSISRPISMSAIKWLLASVIRLDLLWESHFGAEEESGLDRSRLKSQVSSGRAVLP